MVAEDKLDAGLIANAQHPVMGTPAYPVQSGYPAPAGYPPQSGYPTQGGYPPQPAYPAPTGYPPQSGCAQPVGAAYPPPGAYPVAPPPGYPMQSHSAHAHPFPAPLPYTPPQVGSGDERYQLAENGVCTITPDLKPANTDLNYTQAGIFALVGFGLAGASLYLIVYRGTIIGFLPFVIAGGIVCVAAYFAYLGLQMRPKQVDRITPQVIESFLTDCSRRLAASQPQLDVIRTALHQLNPDVNHEFQAMRATIKRTNHWRKYEDYKCVGLLVAPFVQGKYRQIHYFKLTTLG